MPPDALIRLPLPPLSEQAVGHLARAAGRDVRAVWEAAGGNAFFVTELLQSEGTAPPPSVQDAVLARADRLGAPGRAVLDAVSIFPRRAEIDIVEAMVGEDASDGIEECLDHGLLDQDEADLTFRHELARQAVEAALRTSRRRQLNTSLYSELTRTGAPAARRLHHAREARLREAILELAPVAAKAAQAAEARREAAEYYRVAIDAAGATANTDLLEDAAMANYMIARYDRAIDFQDEVLRRLSGSDDILRVGDGWRRLSRFKWTAGDIVSARVDADMAVDILKDHEGPELALAYMNVSQLRMLAYSGDDAVPPAERAIELARKFDRPDIIAQATQNIAGARLYADPEEAERLMKHSVDMALENGHAEAAARGMANWSYVYWWHFRYQEGREVCRQNEPYSAEQELDGYHDYHAGTLALFELELGNLEDAEYWIQRTTAPADVHLQGWHQFPGTVANARWRLRTGRPDDPTATDYLARYLRLAKESQRVAPIAELNAERAWVEGREPGPAIEEILSVIDMAPRSETIAYMRVWLHRLGAGHLDLDVNDLVPEPHRSELMGDPKRAAALWKERNAPYNHAFALAFSGDAASRREAAEIFRGLGAHAHAAAALGLNRDSNAGVEADTGGLTRRQMDVLRCLAEGKSNAQIGEALFISPKTVDHHVSAILGKIGATSRGEAVALARDAGLIG
jgi:DNA-binding CsgD family transcriptional regulator